MVRLLHIWWYGLMPKLLPSTKNQTKWLEILMQIRRNVSINQYLPAMNIESFGILT